MKFSKLFFTFMVLGLLSIVFVPESKAGSGGGHDPTFEVKADYPGQPAVAVKYAACELPPFDLAVVYLSAFQRSDNPATHYQPQLEANSYLFIDGQRRPPGWRTEFDISPTKLSFTNCDSGGSARSVAGCLCLTRLITV